MCTIAQLVTNQGQWPFTPICIIICTFYYLMAVTKLRINVFFCVFVTLSRNLMSLGKHLYFLWTFRPFQYLKLGSLSFAAHFCQLKCSQLLFFGVYQFRVGVSLIVRSIYLVEYCLPLTKFVPLSFSPKEPSNLKSNRAEVCTFY